MTVEMSLAWVYHGSNSTHHEADLLPKDHTVYFWPREFTGILTSISYCSLAFICHFNLLPLQKELHNPTKRRLDTIVIGTMLIAYTLYNIIIFSGYFTVSISGEKYELMWGLIGYIRYYTHDYLS